MQPLFALYSRKTYNQPIPENPQLLASDSLQVEKTSEKNKFYPLPGHLLDQYPTSFEL